MTGQTGKPKRRKWPDPVKLPDERGRLEVILQGLRDGLPSAYREAWSLTGAVNGGSVMYDFRSAIQQVKSVMGSLEPRRVSRARASRRYRSAPMGRAAL